MSKSYAKRSRNNFVRGVRAETAINILTRVRGYLLTRDFTQALKMIDADIYRQRKELDAVVARREEAKQV